MSSLALLIGASPKRIVQTPIVRLSAGTWSLRFVNHIDSVLDVRLKQGDLVLSCIPDDKLNLTQPTDIQLGFQVRGTEDNLSIYAIKQ